MSSYQRQDTIDEKLYRTIDLYDDLLLDILASAKYLKDMIDHYENIADANQHQGPLFYNKIRIMVHDSVNDVDEFLHHHYDNPIYDELYDQMNHKLNNHHEEF